MAGYLVLLSLLFFPITYILIIIASKKGQLKKHSSLPIFVITLALFTLVNICQTVISFSQDIKNLSTFSFNELGNIFFISGKFSLYFVALMIPYQLFSLVRTYKKKITELKQAKAYTITTIRHLYQISVYSICVFILLMLTLNSFSSITASSLSFILLFIFDDYSIFIRYEIESNLRVKKFDRIKFIVFNIIICICTYVSVTDYFVAAKNESTLLGSVLLGSMTVLILLMYNKRNSSILASNYLIPDLETNYKESVKEIGNMVMYLFLIIVLFKLVYSVIYDTYFHLDITTTNGYFLTDVEFNYNHFACVPTANYTFTVDSISYNSSRLARFEYLQGYNCQTIKKDYKKFQSCTVYYSKRNPNYCYVKKRKYVPFKMIIILFGTFIGFFAIYKVFIQPRTPVQIE